MGMEFADSHNKSAIQAFPLTSAVLFSGGATDIDVTTKVIFRALGSGTLTVTRKDGTTLSVAVDPKDDYAIGGIVTLSCDTDFMVA